MRRPAATLQRLACNKMRAERYVDSALRYQMPLSLRANSRATKPVYLLKNLRHLHPHVLDMQGSARHIPVSSAHKNLNLNQVAFALPLKLITMYLLYPNKDLFRINVGVR